MTDRELNGTQTKTIERLVGEDPAQGEKNRCEGVAGPLSSRLLTGKTKICIQI